MRAISDSDARTVYATTWNPAWSEYAGDSTGIVVIKMLNGVRCIYEGAKANASTLNGWNQDYIRAECRDATLELSRRSLRTVTSGPDGLLATRQLPRLSGQPVDVQSQLAEAIGRVRTRAQEMTG